MLLIDGKEFEVTEETTFLGNFNNNGVSGYNINFKLLFKDGNKNGYINLNTGFEKEKDINLFLNREYSGLNFDTCPFMFFEVFDTVKFLDSEIECEIKIRINNIIGDKVNVTFDIDDDLIKIKYAGNLTLIKNI
ncbi:MAG: hypothetical protein Q4C33_02375 [bacterium]|nr:hypothetical protein [bacterium]